VAAAPGDARTLDPEAVTSLERDGLVAVDGDLVRLPD
jgi:hypothetical protein